jgi:UDP-glucose 4-epimerase
MRILITGASGYLGSWISSVLGQKGHKITAVCLYKPDASNPWNSFIEKLIIGNILEDSTLNKIDKKNYDAVIHLISLNHKDSEKDVRLTTNVNVLSTFRLLDFFKNKSLDKFIYFSTIQVLGQLPNTLVDEYFPPKPSNIYGLTHLLCEQIISFYNSAHKFKAINIRLSNGYGHPVFEDNDCLWLVVNDLCRMASKEKKIVLQSDGTPLRDFIHVKDIAAAVEVLLNTPNERLTNHIYNLSSSNTYTILKLAYMVQQTYLKRYGKSIEVTTKYDKALNNVKEVQKFQIDNSQIRKLGFQSKVTLEQGINELFEYFDNKI